MSYIAKPASAEPPGELMKIVMGASASLPSRARSLATVAVQSLSSIGPADDHGSSVEEALLEQEAAVLLLFLALFLVLVVFQAWLWGDPRIQLAHISDLSS
jgi:hypothetical protein